MLGRLFGGSSDWIIAGDRASDQLVIKKGGKQLVLRLSPLKELWQRNPSAAQGQINEAVHSHFGEWLEQVIAASSRAQLPQDQILFHAIA